jgi:hypothetical protein
MLQYAIVLQQCFSPDLGAPKLGTKHGLRSLCAYSSHVRSLVDLTSNLHVYLCLPPVLHAHVRQPCPAATLSPSSSPCISCSATGDVHLQSWRSSTTSTASCVLHHELLVRRWRPPPAPCDSSAAAPPALRDSPVACTAPPASTEQGARTYRNQLRSGMLAVASLFPFKLVTDRPYVHGQGF